MTTDGQSPSLTDLHSHLVPGVDDGARVLEDALEGVERMRSEGIRTIVTTPHLNGSLTRDGRALERRLSEVDAVFDTLAAAVAELVPGVDLRRGHEVMLDVPDPDLSDPRVRLAGTDLVLAEWPRLQIPPETPAVIRALHKHGVEIVIAHAERYAGYDEGMTVVERWRGEGAMCQVNYGSLLGKYGPQPREQAFRLLEQGWVDCLSTDFHGSPSLPLFVDGARETFEKLDATEAWSLLTGINPGRIARGERPLPVPRLEGRPGLLRRLLSFLRA